MSKDDRENVCTVGCRQIGIIRRKWYERVFVHKGNQESYVAVGGNGAVVSSPGTARLRY